MYQRPEDALPPNFTECIVIRVQDDDADEPGKFIDAWLVIYRADLSCWLLGYGGRLHGKIGWWMERPRSPAEK